MKEDKDIHARITKARKNILSLFVEQCANGKQTREFTANGHQELAACGQYIGPSVKNVSQRGVHGTAAALYVLSQSDDAEARALVPKLANYLFQRCELEKKINGIDKSKCEKDENNVIKLSEVLHAFSNIRRTDVSKESFVKSVVEKLKAGMLANKGWSFFLNSTSTEPELIPTAYAIIGLSAVDEDVTKPMDYVINQLDANIKHGLNFYDATIYVLCIYSIAFKNSGNGGHYDNKVNAIFKRVWKELEPTLRSTDIEQNVAYFGSQFESTNYLRIPWQLYLIALACKYSVWKFSSYATRKRLDAILTAAENGGFYYKQSGRLISSRTNAVLFDILKYIESQKRNAYQIWLYFMIDRIRVLFGNQKLRRSLGIVVIGYILFRWLKNDQAALWQVGSDLLASMIIGLISWGKNR